MDYKYIEQLLDRYWECQTTLAEERILREFFAQDNLPEHLQEYRAIFTQQPDAEAQLPEDFDQRILRLVEAENVVHAERNPMRLRLAPFYKAAAIVAVAFTVFSAAQHAFKPSDKVDYDYAAYKDTYSDPQVAYPHVAEALRTMSDGLRASGMELAKDSLESQLNIE